MRYAVGDIHGCLDELKKTLDIIGFSDADRLFGVGDFCDRGTQNLEVLRFLMGMKNFKSVFGNHDIWPYQMLVPSQRPPEDEYDWVLDTWFGNGGYQTMDALLGMAEKEEGKKIASWLEDLPLFIFLEDVVITHNPAPLIFHDFDKLKGMNMGQILAGRYCEKDYDSMFWDRRVINSIQDNRLCNSPVPVEAFHEVTGGKLLVCGHTPVLEGPLYNKDFNLVNIDTGAFVARKRDWYTDGRLTVLNLHTLERFGSDGSKGKLGQV